MMDGVKKIPVQVYWEAREDVDKSAYNQNWRHAYVDTGVYKLCISIISLKK